MTYTEAARINKSLEPGLRIYFRDPKQIADGANLRWLRDERGLIGYVRATNGDGVLLMFPVKSLKTYVGLSHRIITHEEFKTNCKYI